MYTPGDPGNLKGESIGSAIGIGILVIIGGVVLINSKMNMGYALVIGGGVHILVALVRAGSSK